MNTALKVESVTTTKPAPRWKLPEPEKGSLADTFKTLTIDGCALDHDTESYREYRIRTADLKEFIELYSRLNANKKKSGDAYYTMQLFKRCEQWSFYDPYDNSADLLKLWCDLKNVDIDHDNFQPSWTVKDIAILKTLQKFWTLISTETNNTGVDHNRMGFQVIRSNQRIGDQTNYWSSQQPHFSLVE